MANAPKWLLPVAIIALLWNLMGCAAYLSDAMLTAADIAKMSDSERILYNARPAWSVAGTAIAVWFGALGCVALILRKKWALPVLILSLLGVIVQDAWLFVLAPKSDMINGTVMGLQGLVLLVSIGLVALARRAKGVGWLS
jgi:hypothetical protein